MNLTKDREPTQAEHRKAFAEVSFLLEMFTTTIDQIMGGATAPVGRIAGREMAQKLPVYLGKPQLAEVVDVLATRMMGGFAFRLVKSDAGHDLVFDRCICREVCQMRGLPLGGPTCNLFHSYLDGQIDELLARPVKSELVARGESCRARLSTQ